MNFIDASESEVSCNPFAYCENEPVGHIDLFGYWAYDVHAGYYKTSKFNKNEYKKAIYDKKYLYGNQKVIYISMINNTKEMYGTYYWAVSCGFKADYAKIIADECNAVDSWFNGISYMPYIGDQSWHFNTNWGTGKQDSRQINCDKCIKNAKSYFDKASKETTKNNKNNYITKGLKEPGKALHPIQDMYAHTREYCNFVKYKFYPPNKGTYMLIEYWKHDKIVNGVEVDSAQVRRSDVIKARNKTTQILNSIINNKKYVFLKR